ncbi:MAG: glycerophosphodiester phosphodiesterase [Pyrinomonadaceae bacterium]
MRSRWLMRLLLATVALAALLGISYGLMFKTMPQSAHDFDTPAGGARRVLVMAHRGGAGLWPENTMYAFSRAARAGVDVLEMDMHSTSDGALVIIHDDTLERTTNGTGRVNSLTLAQLKTLDAGYRWTPDGGKTFPYRGQGITVPTLEEVFSSFPEMRFNIDIKQDQPSLANSFCRVIRDHEMTSRVMVASFKPSALDAFRQECSEVATSASAADVLAFLALKTEPPEAASRVPLPQALQVPEYAGGRQVVTREFVNAAHQRHIEVHVWTINDETAMRRMLDIGVDGIITDYPDRLIALLERGSKS